MGRLPHVFNVPLDRTPPLSYWLGTAWIRVFGIQVLILRCLSVLLSIASIVAVYMTARRYLNGRSSLICAFLLALSPNFLVEAVEIRAYATFILFSVLLAYSYLRLIAVKPDPSTHDLWLFSVAATLCSYSHFFGIVISAGAAISLLGFYFILRPRASELSIARRAIFPFLFYLIAIAALMPIVLAAVNISGGGDVGEALAAAPLSAQFHDFVRLVYRLFCQQAMRGFPGFPA